MITKEQLTPALIGALVEYQDEGRSEFGLLASYDEAKGTARVRYHLGDTSAQSDLASLTVRVLTLSDSERSVLAYLNTEVSRLHDVEVKIATVISDYGYYDGAHHKDWVLGEVMNHLGLKHGFDGVAP